MTADISRNSLRPPQRFTAVVRQQGRLPLDAEETESGDIAALMLRDVVSDAICEKGTPDDGFRVRATRVGPDGVLDFGVDAGVFYLGGVRCVAGPIPGVVNAGGTPEMTYARQPDWLTYACSMMPGRRRRVQASRVPTSSGSRRGSRR